MKTKKRTRRNKSKQSVSVTTNEKIDDIEAKEISKNNPKEVCYSILEEMITSRVTFRDGLSNHEGLNDIKFIMRSFKPRCSQCFVSHTPKDKWCEKQKMKTKKKTEAMMKKILHEVIKSTVEESERKVKIFHVESILDDVVNRTVEESDAKYFNISNILGNIIDTAVNMNCTTNEKSNDIYNLYSSVLSSSLKL